MFKIETIDKTILVSQRAIVERIEQLQTKYLDTLQNIEFTPVLIARCEEDKFDAIPQKVKELDGMIASHNRNIERAKQDTQYFVDKIVSLQGLLTQEAKNVLDLKSFNSLIS